MENFNILLAQHSFNIECVFEETRSFCRDYLTDKPAELSVLSDRDMAIAEKAASSEEVTVQYAEKTSVYRQIAEQLPNFGAAVFHGAAITCGERGYLFTAPSGTGKSTHIRLWKKYFENVDIINGDKPILKGENEGIRVYSSPWCGKEGWQKNRSAPLFGICIIRQSKENRIRRLSAAEALPHLMRQIYLPKKGDGRGLTLELLNTLLCSVPIFMLDCDISEEAAKTSFEAMTK